jgi:colanic acid/amylovoran biosynthesis protein
VSQCTDGPVTLFGAASGTGNLGVEALSFSVANSILMRGVGAVLAIADFARGVRSALIEFPVGATEVIRFGVSPTKRLHRPESLFRIQFELFTGLVSSESAKLLRSATAILDISGGDSFTDLYGPGRFRAICAPKSLALRLRKPLILLPQTYGPFNDPANRATAAKLVRGAVQCWARDARSFEILRDLLGDQFDPARHRLGVDVAFLLPIADGSRLLADAPRECAAGGEVGINVSGLIWNDPAAAASRYKFKSNYRAAVTTIVQRIAASAPVVLVPHVLAPPGHYEADRTACEAVIAALPEAVRGRVRVCPDPMDPCEAKGLISRCSWFMGTRMHATIAGLSSGVPTCAISYSDKTLGVFETCGQGEHVHDPRKLDTDTLVERVLWSFSQREAARASLATHLPGVLKQAEDQMDEIARVIREAHESRSSGRGGAGRGNAAAGRGSST